MTRKQSLLIVLFATLLFSLVYSLMTLSPLSAGVNAAAQTDEGNRLAWQVPAEYGGARLTITGPEGFYAEREFAADEQPAMQLIDDAGNALVDGQYTFELRFNPVMKEATTNGRSELAATGAISQASPTLSGAFRVQQGVLAAEQDEPGATDLQTENAAPLAPDYFTHPEDVSIQGSLCTGLDCLSSESFGFDTLRLKENNLRIHFDDTSASGSFPSNDWRILINDTTDGGANYFAVENSTSGAVPFKITDSAIADNLFVTKAAGAGNLPRIGVGTAAPQTPMHLVYADTPTLRLQQDNSQGWGDYSWDVAGNESNFFVRDVTDGGKYPFKIQPGAANSSILIRNNGHIGIMPGTSSSGFPAIDQTLYVLAADATFRVRNSTTGAVTLDLDSGGNMTLNGLLTEASDRALKENVVPVNNQTVLDLLAGMPINTWNYIIDKDNVRHMGPMAQDFYAAFGLGADNLHIAPLDANGVALAGVQELYQKLQAKERILGDLQHKVSALGEENAGLREKNADLEQRLADLETAVATLVAQQEQ